MIKITPTSKNYSELIFNIDGKNKKLGEGMTIEMPECESFKYMLETFTHNGYIKIEEVKEEKIKEEKSFKKRGEE
jgi:hypothetical protein